MKLLNFQVSCDDKNTESRGIVKHPSWVTFRDATSKTYKIAVEIINILVFIDALQWSSIAVRLQNIAGCVMGDWWW